MAKSAAVSLKEHLSSERISKGKTYDEMAAELNVSKGVLWKFLNTDYIPTDAVIRSRLGLPIPIIQWRTRNKLGQLE